MAKRKTPEERYKANVWKQQKTLEQYAEHEIEWAEHLISWYRIRKEEMPIEQYRACAFFLNKEFCKKPGSLTLCYEMYLRLMKELPEVTKEIAFELLCFRYKSYANVLKTGGFDGQYDWR